MPGIPSISSAQSDPKLCQSTKSLYTYVECVWMFRITAIDFNRARSLNGISHAYCYHSICSVNCVYKILTKVTGLHHINPSIPCI